MKPILRAAVALAAAATLSACASTPAPAPKASPAVSITAVSRAAAAACSKLGASALPLTAYDELLIAEADKIGGTLSKAQVRHVHAVVAAEVAAGCPKFSYLAKQDQ